MRALQEDDGSLHFCVRRRLQRLRLAHADKFLYRKKKDIQAAFLLTSAAIDKKVSQESDGASVVCIRGVH